MDTEEIEKIEKYFHRKNLELYQLIIDKIKNEFNEIEVSDLADYFDVSQEIKTSIQEYLEQNGYFGDVVPPVSGMLCHSKQM